MKKIIAVALSALVLITAAVGGTLALSGDEVRSLEVYTAGNIDIELEVSAADDEITLFPAVYDFKTNPNPWVLTPTENDPYPLWTGIENVQQKTVVVNNVGDNDAFVRVLIAFENPNGDFVNKNLMINDSALYDSAENVIVKKLVNANVDIDGVNYAIYAYTYQEAVESGKNSAPALLQVALKMETSSAEMALIGDSYEILVCAQAVQTVSDTSLGLTATDLLNYEFGNPWEGEHPWVEPENPGTIVSSAKSLKKALENGGKITVGKNITLSDTLTVPAGVSATIDLNGKTVSATSTAIENNGTLVVGNGTIDVSAATTQATRVIKNNGTLTLNGGTYKGTTALYSYAIWNAGTLTSNGANVIGGFGGVSVNENSKAEINGGTYTVTSNKGGHAVYLEAGGELVINDGTFKGDVADYARAYDYMIYAPAGSSVVINGGTFEKFMNAYNGDKPVAGDLNAVVIKGGTFAVSPDKYGVVASGYVVQQPSDVYEVVPKDAKPVASVTLIGKDETVYSKADSSKVIIGPDLEISVYESIEPIKLNVAYQFEPTMSAEYGDLSAYADWHADFVVSSNKDIPGNGIGLAGYYDLFGYFMTDYTWVVLSDSNDVPAETEVRLLEVMGVTVSYRELCNYGNDGLGFLCGIVDLSGEIESGTTITVELRLHEATGGSIDTETEEYMVIGTYSYTFN